MNLAEIMVFVVITVVLLFSFYVKWSNRNREG